MTTTTTTNANTTTITTNMPDFSEAERDAYTAVVNLYWELGEHSDEWFKKVRTSVWRAARDAIRADFISRRGEDGWEWIQCWYEDGCYMRAERAHSHYENQDHPASDDRS